MSGHCCTGRSRPTKMPPPENFHAARRAAEQKPPENFFLTRPRTQPDQRKPNQPLTATHNCMDTERYDHPSTRPSHLEQPPGPRTRPTGPARLLHRHRRQYGGPRTTEATRNNQGGTLTESPKKDPQIEAQLRKFAAKFRNYTRQANDAKAEMNMWIIQAKREGHSFRQIREDTGMSIGYIQLVLAKAGLL